MKAVEARLAKLSLNDRRSERGGSAPRRTSDQEVIAPSLVIKHGAHQASQGTADLLRAIGGGDRVRRFCTLFYEKAFQDAVLDEFMFMNDGAEAHGKRLGDWIVQKMGGEGEPWSDSGRHGMRQPTHHQAWHCPKRPAHRMGRRFKLDDTRIWMRLMFWAVRDEGLGDHPFMEWYTQFIGHFIAVYERAATQYAQESADWSANPANLEKYRANGNKMTDVIGVGVREYYY